jgi:hypothetical protein
MQQLQTAAAKVKATAALLASAAAPAACGAC